ncbi:hypothetical protein J416_00404 [Gracilibacillus halophilus YIM-C55.5]|uniref:DUF8042 domain-containing protein n=1 Tax=Gracilibacillus halophilus YIM-C55.5 TaxID=1308866 RepID=N4WQJ8_9BACI|nr:hypothetical protein [Gracilibacillus halophilus]ENH98402.1 hypothetical protein J416_00404 [Gracilibacillus halophilus YIM-C55.5]
MEKQIHLMQHILELSETMDEGMTHIHSQLKAGKQDETVYLFEDFVQAFASIENAIETVDDEFKNDEVDEKTKDVKKNIEAVVQLYEMKDYDKIVENMESGLFPNLNEWRSQLETAFQPHTMN